MTSQFHPVPSDAPAQSPRSLQDSDSNAIAAFLDEVEGLSALEVREFHSRYFRPETAETATPGRSAMLIQIFQSRSALDDFRVYREGTQ